jgi:tetratricopeptide (TPR) repeat protein
MFRFRLQNKLISSILIMGLACSLAFGVEPADTVQIKADTDLKLSGKVVGQAKKGEARQVIEVRGAWINIGSQQSPAWIHLNNITHNEISLEDLYTQAAKPNASADAILNLVRYLINRNSMQHRGTSVQHLLQRVLAKNNQHAEANYYSGVLAWNEHETSRALASLNLAIENNAKEPRYFRLRAEILSSVGRHKDAVNDQVAIIELNAADAFIYNNVGWAYATWEMTGFRNGKKAVEYAERACELTGYNFAPYLDTLAAAHAEAGDFPAAERWQNEAIQHCDDARMEKEFEERLADYRLKKAYRTSPGAN